MRPTLLWLILISSLPAFSQNKLVPGRNAVEAKWPKNEQYQMTWYALRDTAKIEIGKVSTDISLDKDKIMAIVKVEMKQMKSPWTDTTIAHINGLQPVYHSSWNGQRDMALHFGKIVSGFYHDKLKNTFTFISDTTKEDYFDSNLYPSLIRWLPLKEGYKQDIAIYDYNPAGEIGVVKAAVVEVKKGSYPSKNSGIHPAWVVTVIDELAAGEPATSIYYIDAIDRKLWKQEITAGGRKMMMERVEN